MRRLVCACVVRKPPKSGFLATRPICKQYCSSTCHNHRCFPSYYSGYLGCWPNSQLKDKYFTVSAPNACYDECKTYCGINDTVVAIKGVSCYIKNYWEILVFTGCKVSKGAAKIRNRYNQVPLLTQTTNGKVTNSQ